MSTVENHAKLPPAALEDLERRVAGLDTLEDVVPWVLARDGAIAEVVVQDEYTHDVIVEVPLVPAGGSILVFDTT